MNDTPSVPPDATPRVDGTPRARVLIVDDEPALRRSLARMLISRGFEVLTAEDGPSALALLATTHVDVALVDLMMPRMSGMELLAAVKSKDADTPVLMMTAHGDIDTAVAAVRAGAYDFLTKPFESADAISITLEKAAEHRRLVNHTRSLEQRLEQHEKFGELVGSSKRMQDVYRLVNGVATSGATVLILGENGTGKELVARAIHQRSSRAGRAFKPINCGAIPETLVESELFGSVKGAFTGATDRAGVFEQADMGTLFLDEIGDLPMMAQVKLLRALSENEVKRVGDNDARHVDVRVLAATNVDLKERIAAGRFREDLYYRLNVIPIQLPPLRMRKDDIPILAYHFLQKYTRRSGRDVKRIHVEAMRALREHPWPGNVRELENAVEHAVVLARTDSVMLSDLPFSRKQTEFADGTSDPIIVGSNVADLHYADAKTRATNAFDAAYVERIMKRANNVLSEGARLAGMDRSNFKRLVKRVKKNDAD